MVLVSFALCLSFRLFFFSFMTFGLIFFAGGFDAFHCFSSRTKEDVTVSHWASSLLADAGILWEVWWALAVWSTVEVPVLNISRWKLLPNGSKSMPVGSSCFFNSLLFGSWCFPFRCQPFQGEPQWALASCSTADRATIKFCCRQAS